MRKFTFSEIKMKRRKFSVICIIALLIFVVLLCVVLNDCIQKIDLFVCNINEMSIELNQTKSKLANSNLKVLNLTKNLDFMMNRLNETMKHLNETTHELKMANDAIIELQTEISFAREGNSYNIHDPTYAEMKSFLEENTVDQNMYELGYYVCRQFGKDLRNDATKEGIRCAYVEFYGPKPDNLTSNQSQWRGHVLVGFDTPDKGFIYIEPQNDREIDIAIGVIYSSIYIEDLLIIW